MWPKKSLKVWETVKGKITCSWLSLLAAALLLQNAGIPGLVVASVL